MSEEKCEHCGAIIRKCWSCGTSEDVYPYPSGDDTYYQCNACVKLYYVYMDSFDHDKIELIPDLLDHYDMVTDKSLKRGIMVRIKAKLDMPMDDKPLDVEKVRALYE